jgi:chaperone required for assembly of F1-ATPase
LEHQIELEAACQAAFVDDCFQINNWGEDAEASLRIANRRREMLEIKEFLDLVLSRK